MVIQIIPKDQEKSFSLGNVLFYLSLVLVLIFLVSYGVLFFLLKNTEKNISALDQKIAVAASSPEAVLSRELLADQQKIKDFASLLSAHKYSSQQFSLIENLAHPKIFFSDFSFDMNKKIIDLSGKADSFKTLDQQITIFKKEKTIQQVEISKIGFDKDGKVQFGLKLTLDSQVFIKQEPIKSNE